MNINTKSHVGMRCKGEDNQGNGDAAFNSSPQIGYDNSSPYHSSEILSSKLRAHPAKTDLFSKVNGTVVEQAMMFNKERMNVDDKATAQNDKIEPKFVECSAKFCRESSLTNFSVTKLQSCTKEVNNNKELPSTNFPVTRLQNTAKERNRNKELPLANFPMTKLQSRVKEVYESRELPVANFPVKKLQFSTKEAYEIEELPSTNFPATKLQITTKETERSKELPVANFPTTKLQSTMKEAYKSKELPLANFPTTKLQSSMKEAYESKELFSTRFPIPKFQTSVKELYESKELPSALFPIPKFQSSVKELYESKELPSALFPIPKFQSSVKEVNENNKELPSVNFPISKLQSSVKEANENKELPSVSFAATRLQNSIKEESSIKFLNVCTNLRKSTWEDRADPTRRNLELNSSNVSPNYESRTVKDLLKPVSYKPRREFSYVSTTAFTGRTSNASTNFTRDSEIMNTVCTNKLDNFKTDNAKYKGNYTSNCERDTLETGRTSRFADTSIYRSIDFCTNANCNDTKCVGLNTERENEHISTATNTKFTKSTFLMSKKGVHCYTECEDKCVSTIDSALDTLQITLKDARTFKSKGTISYSDEDRHSKEIRCKNADCNYASGKNKTIVAEFKQTSFNSQEVIRPECMQMLRDIKKHTETLEEQLTIMNRSIKSKNKASRKFIPVFEDSSIKQRRDTVTQNPEKKNVCVQSSAHYFQILPAKSEDNFDSQRGKKKDVSFREISKKEARGEFNKGLMNKNRTEDDFKSREENFNILLRNKSNEEDSFKSREECTKELTNKNDKEDNFNRELMNKNCEQENTKLDISNYSDNNSSRSIKSVQIQCARSVSFHMSDSPNFNPPAASTPKKAIKNPSKAKEILCGASNCTQTIFVPKENVQITQVDKRTSDKLKSYPMKGETGVIDSQVCATCDQNATVVLLLTNKIVHSRRSKSKYKRSEFLSFRRKCVATKSGIACDQRLISCRISRRKVQIPIVFKLSSARCKAVENLRRDEITFPKRSMNINEKSDLGRNACTQSSNLRITTATSVPYISFNDRRTVDNVSEERIAARDGCILS